jgi:hypothetical protein
MVFKSLKKINANAALFSGHYVDVKFFYVLQFNTVPCITFIGDMHKTEVFAFVTHNCKVDMTATYQHSYFNHDDGNIYFNDTIFVLTNNRMIEIADNYCQVLHAANNYDWADKLVNDLAQFKIAGITPAFRHTHVVGFAKNTEMN